MLAVAIVAVATVAVGIVTVPVNTGDARSDFSLLMVEMAANSAPNSEPLIILRGSFIGNPSFSVKLVLGE